METKIWHNLILFLFVTVGFTVYGQSNSNYSFIVAGHAYGAHAGANIGLHPPFLKKLSENADSSVAAIFLTGDIVNYSTTESWAQVQKELSELGLNAYYVMGNHDDNTIGAAEFQKKHGGTYYSFLYGNELFIVLNSTESDRSISATQLQFLDKVLSEADSVRSRIFIFFHEVIWNSHEKYKLVRSNSRSRYNLISGISNFWDEVFPMFSTYPNKKFFLFAGDVGGNPDAISAFYERWGNVTLLSSGMGEVPDENYLKVSISPDTVSFSLIALNDEVEMHPITWYNVPEFPDQIEGPAIILPGESDVRYQISPVSNATNYRWNLSTGIYGVSDSSEILLRFDEYFQNGEITVTAINDGFGESESEAFSIESGNPTSIDENNVELRLNVSQNQQYLQITYNSASGGSAQLAIYNPVGGLLMKNKIRLNSGLNSVNVEKSKLAKGIVIVELRAENNNIVHKIILN